MRRGVCPLGCSCSRLGCSGGCPGSASRPTGAPGVTRWPLSAATAAAGKRASETLRARLLPLRLPGLCHSEMLFASVITLSRHLFLTGLLSLPAPQYYWFGCVVASGCTRPSAASAYLKTRALSAIAKLSQPSQHGAASYLHTFCIRYGGRVNLLRLWWF